MTRRLVIWEDAGWRALRPLTDLTVVPALTFGASTLAERWRRAIDAPLLAIVARHAPMPAWADAPVAESAAQAREDDEVVAVNAAALPGPWLSAALEGPAPARFVAEGRTAAARVPLASLAAALVPGADLDAELVSRGPPRPAVGP